MKIKNHDGIRYRVIKGWRSFIPGTHNEYQLMDDYEITIPILAYHVDTRFYTLQRDGRLTIRRGYPWNGPSGPTIDTKNFMRGSLVHDLLYEMLGKEQLAYHFKIDSDMILRRIVLTDGMSKARAFAVHRAVRDNADFAAMPREKL